MVPGVSLSTFTLFHVVLSLVGIVSGLVVLAGWLRSRSQASVTAIFLATTMLTSVTGFFFPFERLLPSHVVGILSLVLLGVVLAALYGKDLTGPWRGIYVVAALTALYLNVFVLVIQAFLKVPGLHAIAPTQSDPVFGVAQGVVLAVFVWLGVRAVRAFHPAASGA
jgi:hypothetical protein